MTASAAQRAIEVVWRIESARLIAGLARIVRDVGLAEDLAQDALVAALERWPESGVPDNPGAWLMATAKHRAIDVLRRNARLRRKQGELARAMEARPELGGSDLEPSLQTYHLLPSVRGDLLARLGSFDEARAELERAAGLTRKRPRARAAARARRSMRSGNDAGEGLIRPPCAACPRPCGEASHGRHPRGRSSSGAWSRRRQG